MDISYFSLDELMSELRRRIEANKHPTKKYEVPLTGAQRTALSRAKTKARKGGLPFDEHEWIRENVK